MTDPSSDASSDAASDALAQARAQATNRPVQRRSTWLNRRRKTTDDQRSGPGPDQRDPQRVGDVVQQLSQEQQWVTPLSIGAIVTQWPTIVGDDVAAHVTPQAFRADELVVQADSTAWATQMRLLTATVLRRLDEELGVGVVTKVKVLGPRSPSWKRGQRSVPGRGPHDTYG